MFRFKQHGECGVWLSECVPIWLPLPTISPSSVQSTQKRSTTIPPSPLSTQARSNWATPAWARGSATAWEVQATTFRHISFLFLRGQGRPGGQPLFSPDCGAAAFLPSNHQGVRFRSGADPVLYLSDPPGLDKSTRRAMLDGLARLNQIKADSLGAPEILTRIKQYEMAFRMQSSVPAPMDLSGESNNVFDLYGAASRTPGTFAANCLLACRMAERGVRILQLFHRGWDQHGDLPRQTRGQCVDVDQSSQH